MTREQIMAEIMEYAAQWEPGESKSVEFIVDRVLAGRTVAVFSSDIRGALVSLLRRGDLDLNDDFRVVRP